MTVAADQATRLSVRTARLLHSAHAAFSAAIEQITGLTIYYFQRQQFKVKSKEELGPKELKAL
ncbi:hypothetical protein XYCOK13_27400 [Xylanibacillus composti]|uniref:Uncharacterized protein n=1 Tax=Xylanibacillus composti TaxID=1572762 RepID=A0A8J4H5I5_9BACL|nr:hypothetical protein XYCOK13_27400 [Xylanibacillus composti]